ncbi:MAG: hypothetical protein ACOXZH_02030 [Bacteroidales bacterium]|jgi:hypothetical protein
MNKLKLIIGIILLFSLSSFGQKIKDLNFDIKDFQQKAKTAEWLYMYDIIAWWTTDSVILADSTEIARLGPEWFCFQSDDNNWHAIYGKYENDTFDLVFHYIVDTSFKVKRVDEKVDTSILNGYSRALQTANKHIKLHTDSINIKFNQYIRQNEDKTFDVWFFSAFQPNGWAVYGKEFILKIDKTGNKVLEDNSYYDTDFRGFEVNEPREIWINQTKFEKPTLGLVFFVWYYKKYFTYIKINNKDYITTVIKDSDGSYVWMHYEKDKKEKKKEKKKKKK